MPSPEAPWLLLVPLVEDPVVVPPEGACEPEAVPVGGTLPLPWDVVPGAPVGSLSLGLQATASAASTAAASDSVK